MKDRFQKNKVTIISEIHPQHHGSMDEIKRMILQSKIGGADYVKVQLYSSQNLFNNDERKYIEINKIELKEISDYSRNIGIEPMASVFDEERIDWCEELNFKTYKIASITIKEKKLCQKIISLKNERETTYATYISVQNEIMGAYTHLRNQRSLKLYGIILYFSDIVNSVNAVPSLDNIPLPRAHAPDPVRVNVRVRMR